MALRDQPYLPLYVQDYLTDEKLSMCSWETQGIYIKILCLLHKTEPYGTILLKQNEKQNKNFALDFACKITKLLPINVDVLYGAISQLVEEGCLTIEGDKLFQKRMVRDNDISIKRELAGRKGGLKTQNFAKAKVKANTEYENENINEDVIILNKEVEELFNNVVILFDEDCRPKDKKQKVKWCDTLDKLMRIDNYSSEHIINIVKRTRMDDFWRTNFLTINKLRDKNKDGITYFKIFEKKLINETSRRNNGVTPEQLAELVGGKLGVNK